MATDEVHPVMGEWLRGSSGDRNVVLRVKPRGETEWVWAVKLVIRDVLVVSGEGPTQAEAFSDAYRKLHARIL